MCLLHSLRRSDWARGATSGRADTSVTGFLGTITCIVVTGLSELLEEAVEHRLVLHGHSFVKLCHVFGLSISYIRGQKMRDCQGAENRLPS